MAERDDSNNTPALNVLGTALTPCCFEPVTGFYRDGFCNTGPDDRGVHTVCALMTEEFLAFSKSVGNDLSTPNPYFPGLKPGDKWCLCVLRWKEAFEAGKAPVVLLQSTHIQSLKYVRLEDLKEFAFVR